MSSPQDCQDGHSGKSHLNLQPAMCLKSPFLMHRRKCTQGTAVHRFIVALVVNRSRCSQHRCVMVVGGVGEEGDRAVPQTPGLGQELGLG